MAERFLKSLSLWCVTTRASLVECTLQPLSSDWCELRLSQDNEVVLRERFTSPEAARRYATRLHEQVAKISDLRPRQVMHRAS